MTTWSTAGSPTIDLRLIVRDLHAMNGLFRIPGVGDAIVGVTTGYGSKQHFHDGYSIGIFRRCARIWFRGAVRSIGPNDLVVLEPGEVHGGRGDSAGCRQDGLIIDPRLIARFFGSERPMCFPDAVIADDELAGRFTSGLAERSGCRLRSATRELFVRYGRPDQLPFVPARPPCIGTDQSISAQAETARLSRSHFSRKVRSQVGLSPRDYRRQLRVRTARKLIEEGHPLADTAAQAGFSDQAHMTRQMRSILGVTPGVLRKTGG